MTNFKFGDKVRVRDKDCDGWEEELSVAPKEIEVGSKVRFNSHRNGTVLAKFTDLSDNDCTVVQGLGSNYSVIEFTKNLEHEDE